MKVSEINRHGIWADILTAGSNILGGILGWDAAGDAADAQSDAARYAADLQMQMYSQSREDLAPWRDTGAASLNTLRQMLGMGYWAPPGEARRNALSGSGGPGVGHPASGAGGFPSGNQLAAAWTGAGGGDGQNTLAEQAGFNSGSRPRVPSNQQAVIGGFGPGGPPTPTATATPGPLQMKRVPIYENRLKRTTQRSPGAWDETMGGPDQYERVITGYREVPVGFPGTVVGPDHPKYDQAGSGAPVVDMTETPDGWEWVEGTGEGPPGYEPVPEFTESPGYQWTLDQGLKGQQNALSAMGRNRSGAHIKAATEYAEGLASTEYDNFLNRWYRDQSEKRNAFASQLNPYLALSGQGQVATENTAQLGQNAASNAGQANIFAGNAQAGGMINQTNALTGAIGGGVNSLLYYNSLRNLPQSNYQPNFQAGSPNYASRPVDQWQYGYA